jgi:galactitol-specific phosphotransferase system IIB component
MGLAEKKEGSKNVIVRNKLCERRDGSLIENTIFQLSDYPLNENMLFEIALELTITWINRILFLKLLESQQLLYQKKNHDYVFLNTEKVKNFTDLNTLFFKILAIEIKKRPESIKSKFAHVPYLNSSLFDMTEMEKLYFPISNLQEKQISIFSGTVLKDSTGKRRKGAINTLNYIFEFLEAYDFSSEGSEEIQEENKTLINASVLGLIFEKINGYKDGSFFTPGFITTYICRETIRQVVINKFNEIKGWNVSSFDELKNYIENKKISDIREANTIINSITICDPAVGSGHFLVSALNEIISIKSDLEILADPMGVRLKGYTAEVINDELMIFDDEHRNLFTYNINNPKSCRIQKTIFEEKRHIIEHSLFGVDINPKSVMICRLRLWIELLKNAYYTEDSGSTALKTLPNIDINIKCGDSLVSRFELGMDLESELSKLDYTVKEYQEAVQKYKHATEKVEKKDLENLIKRIKDKFRDSVKNNTILKLNIEEGKLRDELIAEQVNLFDDSHEEKVKKEKRKHETMQKIKEIERKKDDIENNIIYEDAFEWRFEFPELLNNNGDFSGFDVIIGNPPYISAVTMARDEQTKMIYKQRYPLATGSYDIYILFLLKTIELIKQNGTYSWIIPNKFLITNYAKRTKQELIENYGLKYSIDVSVFEVFKNANVYPIIIFGNRNSESKFDELLLENYEDLFKKTFISPCELKAYKTFKDFGIKIYSGTTGFQAQQLKVLISEKKARKKIPFIVSGNVDRYYWTNKNVQYMKNNFSQAYIQNDSKLIAKSKWNFWNNPKIVISGMTKTIEAVYSDEPLGLGVGIYGIYDCGKFLPLCLTAILNSKFLTYYFRNKFKDKHLAGGYLAINKSNIEELPLVEIPASDQRTLAKLAEKIHFAKKEDPLANTSKEEKSIDNIIYRLYGLTAEEVRVIEE